MITVNGRFFAAAFLTASGLAIAAIGAYSYASNRITLREVIGGAFALVVALVAGLWLRRDKLHGGQS